MILQSEKVTRKDNQQERLKTIGWIVGFIDGEGCFSITLHKNHTTKLGWQVMPEFVATQSEKSINALIKLQDFFKCGQLIVNHRHDNHKGDLYRYCVRSLNDLQTKIVPFFEANHLQTSKDKDFKVFAQIIGLMNDRRHLTREGIEEISSLAMNMNTGKKRKLF